MQTLLRFLFTASALLVMVLLSACTVSQSDPDDSNLQTPRATPTFTPFLTEAERIFAAIEPRIDSDDLSPDGLWRTQVLIYDCVAVDEEMISYEELRLIREHDGSHTVIDSQLINCGGLGAFGLEGRGWSDDSQIFSFTDAREGVPDGAGDWHPPLYRYNIVSQNVEQVEDVSGKTLGNLAYVDNGDIWIKTLPDGEPLRITDDGVNTEPSWSPSGEWLTFRKLDSQLWLYSLVKNKIKEVEPGAPVNEFAWSSTENKLAYTVGSGIVHLRLDDVTNDDSTILLPPNNNGFPQQLHWSLDGQTLAFVQSIYDTESNQIFDGISIMPAEEGDAHPLLQVNVMETGSLQLGAWSSDGERLLFWLGPRPIDSFIPETVDLLSIAVNDIAPEFRFEAEQISWMDSRFLAIAPAKIGDFAVTVGDGPPWTNKRIFVGHSPLTPADQAAAQPAWSHDGLQLAYAGMLDQGEVQLEQAAESMRQRHIWMIDADGVSEPRQLTSDPTYRDEYPQWSADGAMILFARLDAEDKASLWLVESQGGEPQQVVQSIQSDQPWHGIITQLDWQRMLDWHR